MSRFQFFFSFIYIGVLFFCIFARIESWPFSDYRVFMYNNHPERIVYYAPFFKLSSGEYFNPGTRKFYFQFERVYFHTALRKMDPPTLERYLISTAKSEKVQRFVERMRRHNMVPVKFVAMKVTFKQDKNNKWQPIHSPVKEYDIP